LYTTALDHLDGGSRAASGTIMTAPEDGRYLDLLRASGAWLEGHFRLSSGLHSSAYLQCARVLQHPDYAAELGTGLALEMRPAAPQVVLSPALGGIVIGHEVARALGVRAIFAERSGESLTLRRGFELVPGERVLVVEDVVTTGLSTRETIAVARAAGATVVGAAAIVDRSDHRAGLEVPFAALITLQVPAWEAADCPLCLQGLPVVKPGSRPGAEEAHRSGA
jgi:orotate phosphoribosyltransferase